MVRMIVFGKTDQETIKLTAESMGVSLAEAEFLLAIARGEVSGQFAIPEYRKIPLGKKRLVLPAGSRRTLERLKEERQKDKASDAQGTVRFSGLQGYRKFPKKRGETASKLARKAVKPRPV